VNGPVLKLTYLMPTYDFSKEPLASAEIVINQDGRCSKDRRHNEAGRLATEAETAEAVAVDPNR
jgi:hypothetical protein